MITMLVLRSRMPKKLIGVPPPPPPPPPPAAPAGPKAFPVPPALIMLRGALSGLLISGIGGSVTLEMPVVRTRRGTAGGALVDCVFFCNWTRCSSARSLGLGDFGPALKVSLRAAL